MSVGTANSMTGASLRISSRNYAIKRLHAKFMPWLIHHVGDASHLGVAAGCTSAIQSPWPPSAPQACHLHLGPQAKFGCLKV